MEALLFSAPKPIALEDAARILAIARAEVESVLDELEKEYASDERGFFLERVGGGVRLCSKPEYAAYVEELGRTTHSGALSQAALETLAIVAYKQPITRPQIEAIRGVRVDSAIASLVDRGLIEEKGRFDGPGRPILYGTSAEFLVRFGLNDLSELPPLKNVDDDEMQPTLNFGA